MDSKELINKIADKLGMPALKFGETEVVEVTLAEAKLEDGTIVYSSDEIALGVQVFTDAEMTIALKDDEYVLDDGTKIEVIDGVVGVYEPVEAEVAPEEVVVEEVVEEDEEATKEEENTITLNVIELTDGEKLYYAPEVELDVDVQLYNDELMTEVATELEYSTVDGLLIKTQAGIVTEILSVIEEYKRMKALISDNLLDVEDLKSEFTALIDINTKLEATVGSLKAEKDAAAAVDSINFSKTEVNVKTKKEKFDVYAYLDSRK